MEKRSSFRIAEWDYRVPSVIREDKYKSEFYIDIPSLEGKYQISNLYNVRSWIDNKWNRRKEPKLLKQWLSNKGYTRVCLSYNGKHKNKYVHQLMWLAWRGEIPEGYQVNHINEIKTDNRLDNLNLMTPKENTNYGTCIERRAKAISKAISKVNINNPKISKPVVQKTLQGEVIKIWPSIMEIQRQLGYENTNICKCCKGGHFQKGKWYKLTQAYGYKWEYAED